MKVLVALDDSPISARAAREAVRLFGGRDTEFFVISVATLPVMWAGSAGYGMVTPMAFDDAVWQAALEAESDVRARAEEAGIDDPEVCSAQGDAVTLISQAADENDVDVVVVGSLDKSVWRRIFDPSVAVGVVRATYRPVLVVSGEPPG